MNFTLGYIIAGVLLVGMALSSTVLKRLPLSTSMLYLAAGVGLGPAGLDFIRLDFIADAALLERIAELAVMVSLFTAGLKLSLPMRDPRWFLTLRLATIAMVVTIGLIALIGVFALGLSWGSGHFARSDPCPNGPVAASDVQAEDPSDADRLRFGLTGEAGLNDGAAFPFVMLGLGLLGLHDLSTGGWLGIAGGRWIIVDVLWATAGGLAIGGSLGMITTRLFVYLRREHKEAVGLDDFIALGLIALSYGVALLVHTYGFLAVFAAGIALRRVERQSSGGDPHETITSVSNSGPDEEQSTHPEKAAAYMAEAVLGFTEQLERILEVAVVIFLGAMLSIDLLPSAALWFIPLLFLGVRPLAVMLGLLGTKTSRLQRGLMSWFGIRGIGSIYYLAYAIAHGLDEPVARELTALTLSVVAASIFVHGVSVTPLMNHYREQKGRTGANEEAAPLTCSYDE